MPILTCERLSASYGANQVLSDVSFYVKKGECLSILGENGTGKSTLIKCLLGLMKPTSGHIVTDGFAATEVGYLPQQINIRQDFPASVFEVVLSGCLNMRGAMPFYSKREKQLAETCMDKLEIAALKRKSFCALSGGQQQRVLLARALCCAKKLLILDEPASGLDPAAANEMYRLILKLKQEEHLGIIMVSHDTKSALSVSERVLHITRDCGDYFFGTKDEYQSSSYSKMFTEVTHDAT